MTSRLFRPPLSALAALAASCLTASLHAFTFTETNGTFTYSDAQRTFTGIFVRPAGSGPFPAIILNHGHGGTPSSYALPKANEMSPWGLVCIGPELTHKAGGDTSPEGSGNCPENVARGEACLAALASLGYVDTNRIAIWGHSKGAFATVGQAAALGSRIRAAGLSAGGCVLDSFGTNQAAPTILEATPVVTPFILFHGDPDPIVPTSYSATFQSVLASNGVPQARHLYDTTGLSSSVQHNLHQGPTLNADMLARFRDWLTRHGVLPVNHRPTLSWMPDLRVTPGSPVSPVAFTVADAETPAPQLSVTADSSNPALLPATNLVFTGTNASRSAFLTPVSGQTGLTTVTLTVSDSNRTASRSFTLTVAPSISGNTPPVLQSIPPTVLPTNTASVTWPLVIKDDESAEAALTLSATSSNTGLVSAAGLSFGGQNWGRTLTVSPASNRTGRTTITLHVSDGTNLAATSFVLDVVASNAPPAVAGLTNVLVANPGAVPVVLPFSVSDPDSPADQLRVSAASSQTGLVASAALALAGTGTQRTLTLTPTAGRTGVTTVTLALTDGEFTQTAACRVIVRDPNTPARRWSRPRGIYCLDSGGPTNYVTTFGRAISLRDANLRNLPFVDGLALRVAWSDIEGGPGAYDFHIIRNALEQLPPGQTLSLLLVPGEPDYLASTPGVTTWNDAGTTRAVPWDPWLRERRRALITALAAYSVEGQPLATHPKLVMLDPFLPGGHTGIRDPNTTRLRDLPGYSRATLLAAVQDELRALQDAFPGKFVQIGFWPVTDLENAAYAGLTAWEWIRQQLLAEFNGLTRPRIGFFMENLAARRSAADVDPLTATPNSSFAGALFLSQTQAWTGFQMLGSWTRPFNDGHVGNTLNGSPADAIEYAFETFGTEYHEVYISDIDHPAFQPALQAWHDFFASAATTAPDSDEDGDTLPYAWEQRHALHPRLAQGVHGGAGDPDGDGLPNLTEFAFDLDPKRGDGQGLPVPGRDPAGHLTFTYRQRTDAPWLTYTVEVSSNLTTWQSGPAVTEPVGLPVPVPGTALEQHTVRLLPAPGPAAPRAFTRIRVVPTPP